MNFPEVSKLPSFYPRTESIPQKKNARYPTCAKFGRAICTVISVPFRLASTLVNGGVFATYYVTNLALTGLVATGGTIFGLAKIGIDKVRKKPHKNLSEYAIKPSVRAFNYISKLYYNLPKQGPELIFSGVTIGAVVVAVCLLLASSNSSGSSLSLCPCFGFTRVGEYSGPTCKPLRPYHVSLELGRIIMEKTSQVINQNQGK